MVLHFVTGFKVCRMREEYHGMRLLGVEDVHINVDKAFNNIR